MRVATELVADVLSAVEASVAAGVTTADLDRQAERLVRDAGAEPAFKGYRGYPATLCASVNQEVVHGIPSASRVLREGDIISLDIGVRIGGFFGDSAVTVAVGQVPEETAQLLLVTREALDRAIAAVQVGGRLSDIGHAVQDWVETHGFSIVREFVGHGIGERLHEDPQIPNYGPAGRGPKLAEGMVLAIEPMVAMGRPETRVLADGWTAVTRDGSLAAHFEHTVVVSADGPLVLTARTTAAGTRARQGREVADGGHARAARP
jgi:methionyl aminopeptidase